MTLAQARARVIFGRASHAVHVGALALLCGGRDVTRAREVERHVRLIHGYVRALRGYRAVDLPEALGAPHDLEFPVARLAAQSIRLLAALPLPAAPPADRPAVVLAEPSLLGAGGHHLEIAMLAARAYRDRGFDVRVLANRRFRRAPRDVSGDGLDPVPVFEATVYETLYAKRLGHRPYAAAFLANAAGYAADLEHAVHRLRIGRPDLVVFPTSSIVEIAGATLLRPSFLRPGSRERQAHLVYTDPRAEGFEAWSPYGPRFQQAVRAPGEAWVRRKTCSR